MPAPFVRNPYNYDMNKAGDESGLNCKDKTLTQQSFKEECDINTIVERFGLTGEMPQVLHLPAYGDYEGIFDFQTAMNAIRQAQESFMNLPAKLRARFHNEPQELLEFCADANNKDEAIKLGLVEKTPDVAPQTPTAAAPAAPGTPLPSGGPTAPAATNTPK